MKPHFPFVNGGTRKSDKAIGLPGINYGRVALAVATPLVLSVVLSIHLLPSKVSLKLGDISPEDIIANRTVIYRDTTETDRRKEQAAQSVPKQYDPDPNASEQAQSALRTVLHAVDVVRSSYANLPVDRKIALVRSRLGSLLGSHVSDRSFATLLSAEPETVREVEDCSQKIVNARMSREIRDNADLQIARESAAADAAKMLRGKPIAAVVGEIAGDALRPNQIYSEARTLERRNTARDRSLPVYKQLMARELVLAKGQQVLQEHIDKLEALGLRHPKFDYTRILSLTLLVAAMVALMSAYLARYHPNVYSDTKTLCLLTTIVIFGTLAMRVGGSLLGINLSSAQVGYLGMLWVATAGMLIAVLVNPQIAVVVATLMSIVVSLLLDNELRYAVCALLTAFAGIYSVANIRGRGDYVRAVGILGVTGVGLVWIVGGISGDRVQDMLIGSVWAGVIAMAATWLFLIGTALLERPFNTTTHISLLELADTNKPLLRRMVMEAPGTYTHSVAVGHLSESAAEAIGADSLLARVASYYHDIGKLRRPHFFIENQHVENVHDRINPTLSALVITSHIKDGLEIAREYKLPKVIQDVIEQHHGTSLAQYFYTQFTSEQDPSVVLEQQFRYSGPKPQTKEAAITMLADSVEAASRSLNKPTPSKIELLVNNIVAEKLRDGQLDESDLTFREVSKITSCFARVLTSTMHARIEYPDATLADERKTTNANTDTERAEPAGEAKENQETGPTAAAS